MVVGGVVLMVMEVHRRHGYSLSSNQGTMEEGMGN